jgi:hypothetical protein
MGKNNLCDELKRLFQTAQTIDEFEFINVLIGYNGMGDQRVLTHLYESRAFIDDIKSLIQNSSNKHTKTRLGLLLYCHIFEMNELYNILGNLLRVSMGQGWKYIPDLYNRYNQTELSPTEKINRLKNLAEQCKFDELISEIEKLYNNRIRNAFFHSSYSLIEDDFCIVKGEGINIGKTTSNIGNIDGYLLPKINATIDFIDNLFSIIDDSKLQYTGNKIIQGRFPDPQPIVILGDPEKGLIGFHCLLGGAMIKVGNFYGQENFVYAMNLLIHHDTEEIAELKQQLLPYEDKQTPVGSEFDKVVEDVLKTNDPDLIRSLAVIYYNWANNTVQAAKDKSGKEKEFLLKTALDRYDLSLQTDSSFSLAYHNKATTMLKVAKFLNTMNTTVRTDAIVLIKECLKHQSHMFEGHLNIGQLLFEIGFEEIDSKKRCALLQESIKEYTFAIEIYPKDAYAFISRGNAYWKLATSNTDMASENYCSAISDYENSIELNPELSSLLGLATLFGDYADFNKSESKYFYEKSIKVIEEAEVKHGHNSDTHYRKGNKYMMLANLTNEDAYLKRAFENYESAVSLDPINIQAWNNWGVCLMQMADKEEKPETSLNLFENAIEKLETALKINPNHDTAYYNLGKIYLDIWKKSHELDRNIMLNKAISNLIHGESLREGSCGYYLAKSFALKNEPEKSMYWLEKFLKDNSIDKEIITKDSDFEDLLQNEALEALLKKYCEESNKTEGDTDDHKI